MARNSIVKQIPDLQIEWATRFANQSLRTFLIDTKKFSERQYRYIMAKARASEWEVRKGEIQNKVAAESIEAFARDAALVHRGFIVAAQTATAVVHKRLASQGASMKSSDLVNLVKTLAEAQEVYCKAMGLQENEGLIQKFVGEKVVNPAPKPSSDSNPDLSYEDIMTLIELKREMKCKS